VANKIKVDDAMMKVLCWPYICLPELWRRDNDSCRQLFEGSEYHRLSPRNLSNLARACSHGRACKNQTRPAMPGAGRPTRYY